MAHNKYEPLITMINYPNKKVVSSQSMTKEEKNEKTKERKILSAANRGMDFEHAVNTSNTYYDDCQRKCGLFVLNVKRY